MANKMLNIGGDANDASYRYQMHPLKTKIEGRGNGIKTVITNITTVASELHTDPSYITKFFGMECGAVSKYDNKRNVGIVNGKRDTREYQKMLTRFITDFILCPKCGLPELKSKIYLKQLKHRCESCGWRGVNKSTHRVKTFIINNPTASIKAKGDPSKSKPEKKPKGKKGDRGKSKKGSPKPSTEGKEDVDGYNDMGGEDEEVWSVDISLEAVAARKQKEMERLAKKGGYKAVKEEKKSDDVQRDSAVQILKEYMKVNERTEGEIIDEVKRISLARKYDLRKTMELILDALVEWNESINECMDGLKMYQGIFRRYTCNDRHDGQVFISVTENYICKRDLDEGFMNQVYKLLECLYDNEILDEEDLLNWNDTPTDKAMFVDPDDAEKIRNRARPFINWLRDDEDEDEEGEQAEEEVEEDEDTMFNNL